jgi:RsiW-degrading membrane proteinase PrsW (M82 family)
MRVRYWQARAVAVVGLGTIVWSILADSPGSDVALIVASAGIPVAVLLFVSGRLDAVPPVSAVLGGGTVGVIVAVVGHSIVFAFAYLFFAGFAEAAMEVFEAVRVDPRLTTAVGSPWTILLLVELVIVAPLVEEVAKALGSRAARVLEDRRSAFLAGVAAGTGFAIVENLAYALSGGFLGTSWEAILTGRMLGAAVHPLASGLVVMGWWEWRQNRDYGLLVGRFFTGVGVHALWNGSLVMLAVVSVAYDLEATPEYGLVTLAYSAALGAGAAAALWRLSASLADDGADLMVFDATDGRVVGAWTVLAAMFLVPVALLLLAFPAFVSGG